jgi:Mg2+/Co2+ transporter CorB
LSIAVRALGPLIIVIEAFVRRLLIAIGISGMGIRDILSGVDELRGQVDLLHKEGEVEKAERDMLEGLLDLSELSVEDVMVHRTKMRMIDADLPSDQIIQEALSLPYTRIPLWRGTVENIVGVLHARDLLKALHAAGGRSEKIQIDRMISPPWFVPDVTAAKAQLRAFLARKAHFALVIDEYGDVQGLVTLEDILEEIVGDIKDEHDEVVTQRLKRQADGSVTVEGIMAIRDLNRAVDWNLPDENATTIAGLLMHETQTIPSEGQSFVFHGARFHVLRKLRNRITLVRITPVRGEDEA